MSESLPATPVNLDTVTAEIQILKRQTAASIIEIGRRLILAKELVGHGAWGDYLRHQVQFSPTTAKRFMAAAEEFANRPALVDLEPTKVYLLMEAPEENRDALAERAPDLTTRQLEEAVREANRAKAEAERLVSEAKRENAELARRLEKANQRAAEADNRPPKVIEKEKLVERTITVADPRQTVEMDRLRKELKQAEQRHNDLLATAQGTAQAQRDLEAARKQVESMQKRLQRLSVQFDDAGRDQYGGSKLMDAMELIQAALPKTLAEVRVLKRVGVGGPCDDDTLKALLPQIRELADSLDEILKDRASRPINVTPTEVQ